MDTGSSPSNKNSTKSREVGLHDIQVSIQADNASKSHDFGTSSDISRFYPVEYQLNDTAMESVQQQPPHPSNTANQSNLISSDVFYPSVSSNSEFTNYSSM